MTAWVAQPNDLIGGWCVTVGTATPAEGNAEVADFCDEATARLIADLHNAAELPPVVAVYPDRAGEDK